MSCGDWNRYSDDNEIKASQKRDVKYITNHPRFSGAEMVENDMSLVHLKKDFKLDSHLDTICLPEFINDREGNYDKFDCTVMGWGKEKFEERGPQNVLKQVSLPIVDNPLCQAYLRRTRLRQTFSLHESFLCAGGERGADACTGDGGGPLVCTDKKDTDRYALCLNLHVHKPMISLNICNSFNLYSLENKEISIFLQFKSK